MGVSTGCGGRWTAVNSLWTYVHRVLHLLGIAAVDKEEVSLLSAPLVRIRRAGTGHVLAHDPTAQHPDEPFGWPLASDLPSADASFFLLHFDPADPQHPDRARLATAAPAFDSPRAWLAVDRRSGALALTVSERSATLFELQSLRRGPGGALALRAVDACDVGQYLALCADAARARVAAPDLHTALPLHVDHVPLPPTLTAGPEPPADYTLATAYHAPRAAPVRLQSAARGWFVASKPGCVLAAAGKSDAGWDAFALVYDSATRTALLRDARGQYVRFADGAPGYDGGGEEGECGALIAGRGKADTDAVAGGAEVGTDGVAWVGARAAERFAVCVQGDGARDDAVVLKSRKGYVSARRGGRVCVSRRTDAGAAERFHLRVAPPSATGLGRPRVRLRRVADGGGSAREVEGSVVVASAADMVYAVLRDYERFAEFMGDASESGVVERLSAQRLTVRMVQCHSFLMLTIPMTMVLDVVEDAAAGAVTMRLIRGMGIKRYCGTWQAVSHGDARCLLRCTVVAAPAVPAPGFLLDGLIMHAMSTSMAEVAAEAVRRSAAAAAKGAAGKPAGGKGAAAPR